MAIQIWVLTAFSLVADCTQPPRSFPFLRRKVAKGADPPGYFLLGLVSSDIYMLLWNL